MPAATGFITAVRRPRATKARVSATVTSVLPTPVSVPVMKKPCFAGVHDVMSARAGEWRRAR